MSHNGGKASHCASHSARKLSHGAGKMSYYAGKVLLDAGKVFHVAREGVSWCQVILILRLIFLTLDLNFDRKTQSHSLLIHCRVGAAVFSSNFNIDSNTPCPGIAGFPPSALGRSDGNFFCRRAWLLCRLCLFRNCYWHPKGRCMNKCGGTRTLHPLYA